MKELLTRLTAAFGPAGREEGIRALLQRELENLGESGAVVDDLGNLIVSRGEPADRRILVAAHMDGIGFMITCIEENGFLRFTPIGGIQVHSLPGTRLRFRGGITGVIGQEKIKEQKDLEFSRLYIDIGAASGKEAEQQVQIGDTAVFNAPLAAEGDRFIAGALDDRAGCALLLETLKRLPSTLPQAVSFVFTVQEEVGLRGAQAVSYRINPQFGLAVDVTRTGDTPEPQFKTPVSLGKGPAIKIKDNSVICHPRVTALMRRVAEEKNIPYQIEVLEQGGTDAGAIHLSRTGVPTGALSIPCRYIHTPGEMVDRTDMENGVSLLLALLQTEWNGSWGRSW
ncbi:MAG: M42 family metallopeptidase [Bacillota bacterium]